VTPLSAKAGIAVVEIYGTFSQEVGVGGKCNRYVFSFTYLIRYQDRASVALLYMIGPFNGIALFQIVSSLDRKGEEVRGVLYAQPFLESLSSGTLGEVEFPPLR
jgi:hypothetical protein